MVRFVRISVVVLFALAGVSGEAVAQKIKDKSSSSQPAVETQLDPSDPADLEEILDTADAFYFDEGNYEEAFAWYSLAAEGGSAYAQNRLALMYDNGEHVAEDEAQAFAWFRRAAEGGLPIAMGNVGNMYELGDGVTQDYAQALDWYRKGADAGDDFSMLNLGYMYLGGIGVAKDPVEASAWFERAVETGNVEANWMLALRYLYGDGVGMDTQRAAELTYFALVHGYQVTREELRAIADADTSPNFRRALQQMLADGGFYKGRVDASFGPQTQTALDAAFGSALN
jgi:TPR repeat protein